MKHALLILISILSFTPGSFACSCFGPETFCGTLDPQPPQFPEPEWWVPDAIILGVKVAQEWHGMDVEVLQTISGSPMAGDILRVWGDCGLLCRVYPDAWEIGDTVVWALKYTDLMGNGPCGTAVEEQEGDYMISICGTYYLDFDHGTVSGPIAEGVNELPYEAFVQMISTCLVMALPEGTDDPSIDVTINDGQLIARSSSFSGTIEHELLDAQGKLLSAGTSNGHQVIVPISDLATGVHLLQIEYGRHSRILRVLIP